MHCCTAPALHITCCVHYGCTFVHFQLLHYSALFCTFSALFCIVLHCMWVECSAALALPLHCTPRAVCTVAALLCTFSFCTVLHCSALFLHCSALFCTACGLNALLHCPCTAHHVLCAPWLHFCALSAFALFCTVQQFCTFSALFCTILPCTVPALCLHCVCTALHCCSAHCDSAPSTRCSALLHYRPSGYSIK